MKRIKAKATMRDPPFYERRPPASPYNFLIAPLDFCDYTLPEISKM